jgi:aryl-alcohol dehydrogenase-like predicted oxidoreductase
MATRLLPMRPFGATGVTVPLLGYGTALLGREGVSRAHAERCLNHAIDSGITYLDTSPDYGSEPHLGAVMRSRRNEVFLATKVNKRSKESVLEEFQKSLEKLQTDHVDLIQIHAVNAYADLEQALATDGTVEALEEARAQGMVRFIGITGHARPEILAHALTEYPFDAVLCALGIVDHLVSAADKFLLPVARERNSAVIAMKVVGHGTFPNVARGLRYALGLPGVSLAIVGMDSTEQITQNVEIVADFKPLTEAESEQLVEDVRPLIEKEMDEVQKKGKGSLFWLHDTKVTGWQQKDEPVMVSY